MLFAVERLSLPPPPQLSCDNHNKARNNIDKPKFDLHNKPTGAFRIDVNDVTQTIYCEKNGG